MGKLLAPPFLGCLIAVSMALNGHASERSGVIPSAPCNPSAEPSSDQGCNTPVRDHTKPWQESAEHGEAVEGKEAEAAHDVHKEQDQTERASPGKRSDTGDLPYVYDASAKPRSGTRPDGQGSYPLYYTSYHMLAPSPAESRRPGIEYFGEPPESTDPSYYGLYQDLARDVFAKRYIELRNAGDPRAKIYAKPGGHPRRLRRDDAERPDDEDYYTF
ncbi:hypothetical protein BESB_077630 [Besnoitia besnoiti]|uniref:Transmembrane protein n=1 Tax=Besnoitia besnoiti TaxID=94643 RepID=A0A2A9MC93_BESBE|nr:hypothetical protein BESB_077630 [Besnoitia besnoiti]PFH33546.1 hypothetical protein BESB_077630 [Besnoitia besnoiti]